MSDVLRLAAQCIKACLFSSVLGVPAVAETIRDPVQYIIDEGGVSRDDSVLAIKWDWNEDGKDDYFIIPKSEAGDGATLWTVYLSQPDGMFAMAESGVDAASGDFRVQRLNETDNKWAVIRYARVGPEGASIDAIYLDGRQRIQFKNLAFVTNPENEEGATSESILEAEAKNKAAIERYVTPSKLLQSEEFPVWDRWPPNGPKLEPPPSVNKGSR